MNMKKISALGFFTLFFIIGISGFTHKAGAQEVSLQVLSYNIRLAVDSDAPNTWTNRKENVFLLIREAKPDVFGLQEVLKEQLDDLEKAFPEFQRVGVARDDGRDAGEFSPLFFNPEKFILLASGTFWLSETPDVPGSRGWDAACNRVVTWIQLKDKLSKKDFFVFCTHFDHMGEMARRNSAKLLVHAVDSLAGNEAVVVLGDFNALPGSEPYMIITDYTNTKHLNDSRLKSTVLDGPEYTFTGFAVAEEPGGRIDYVFVKNISNIEYYKVNPANNGEFYPSDHLPVNVGLWLK